MRACDHREVGACAMQVWSWKGDRRIKALVVAAPVLGFAFDRAGLASLTMPL